MATNLDIDPRLIDQALAVSGERTKKAAVTRALQEFIARRGNARRIFNQEVAVLGMGGQEMGYRRDRGRCRVQTGE